MSIYALTLVVLAAVLHALWNLITKQVKGGLPFFWLVSTVSAVLSFPFLIWELSKTGIPHDGLTLGLALGSAVLHVFYFVALQVGYHKADLSIVYPVARGVGPLLSVAGAVILFGERPGWAAVAGFILIIGGVVFLTGFKLKGANHGVLQGLFYGSLTGLFIAAYTLWDKSAVVNHHVSALFITFASVLLPLVLLIPVVLKKRVEVKQEWTIHWKQITGVAVLQPLSYILVLVAMKTTPLTYVAPIRELSIVFGVFFGVNLLKEKDSTKRMIAAVVILGGIVMLALS
ncbi:putative membrane protein [Chitinophaga dinghuensis]|uniref:Putative membrane protein n=1 Tax=Chitinophaga dinghuensis TaxID=1539050 RepID=A0A327VQA3_9BACT|nr:DMT family transporter [Chitinophaga dinghuensis]RAJ77465.1 putative membrane protein [Chitinophaga dinghuensis]